jgi:hypothetical protein
MLKHELPRSRKNVYVFQLLEDLYLLNRVGVYPTLGMLARVYNVTRYQVEKSMCELTSTGIAERADREWRKNSMAHTYILTGSGIAMVKAWFENECISEDKIDRHVFDLAVTLETFENETVGLEVTEAGKEAANNLWRRPRSGLICSIE